MNHVAPQRLWLKTVLSLGMIMAAVLVVAGGLGLMSQDFAADGQSAGAPAPEPQDAAPDPVPPDAAPAPEPPAVAEPDAPAPGEGVMRTPSSVYEEPNLDSPVIGRVEVDEQVEIYCTAVGETVAVDDGTTSDLWNFIGGGFVPDVAVYTGTDLPTAPPC